MEKTSTTHRKHRRRFERDPASRRPPLRLQQRDRDIIKLIYDHRFLTTPMIEQLLGDAGKSHRGILLRLQKLYHGAYLDRVRLTDVDNPPIVYALGNKGADILTSHFGIDRQKVDWTSKNREVTERYLSHGLMIARFRLALELATKFRQDTAIHFWEPDGVVKDSITCRNPETQQEERIPVVPDAFFALRDGTRLHPIFLEIDRSTMTHERFARKLRGYYELWNQKLRGGQTYVIAGHSISAFRVAVVTVSESRAENLRVLAREAAGGKQLRLFWFVAEVCYKDNPANVLNAHWRTPADTEPQPLLRPQEQ